MENEVATPSRRSVALTLVVLAFAVACGKASSPKADSATRTVTQAESSKKSTALHLVRRVDHVPEAGDLQRLVVFDAKGVKTLSPATGELMPLPQTGDLDDTDFAEDSLVVATVTANDNFPDLGLTKDEEDSLYLFKESAHTWTASMQHNGVKKDLKVAHYTYKFTQAKDFPNTARFDVLGNKQVIGVRCGNAWCLIGDLSASIDVPDPDGTDLLKPATRRVRGWFDRKERPVGSGDTYAIYPIDGLAKKRKSAYKDAFDQVATIQSESNPAMSAEVWLAFDTAKRQWVFEYRRAGYASVDRIYKYRTPHPERRVPGSARWDKSDAGLKMPTGNSLGDLWVRCANGCCSAEAIMPDAPQ